MSKQLIHAYKSHVVIVALSDRAYAIVSDQKDPSLDARVIELLPPLVTLNDAKNASTRQETNATDFNEIQSVCCTEIDSRIWLAVSREDKTLSLYCTYATDDANEMRPLTTYNMPKRARCLVFNSVSSASLDRCRSIIIAGDLSGDAYAYPVSDSSRDSVVAVAKASRRLLLGHTASMLTGMQVVMSNTNAKQKFILTADRDEKVRVSVFPETHIIHGYLLGHSAFISTMDAVSKIGDDERSLCLTGSGDGTVRLWDYQSCKEVGMVPIVLRASNEHDNSELNDQEEINDCVRERKEDDVVEYDSDFIDYDGDEECSGLIAVPLAVALSSDASYAVVARDGIPSIDIHPIPKSNTTKKTSSLSSLFLSQLISLHKKQTLTCPSQPLDLCLLSDGSVLVLVREPHFLIHFKCAESNLMFDDVTATSKTCVALKSIATSQNIHMPTTTLEYNEDGTLKLQKKIDNKQFENDVDDVEDKNPHSVRPVGLHWNDKERRNTHRLANGRRRRRKLKETKNHD